MKESFAISIIFILILFFSLAVRFYKLGAIPQGLFPDEAALGYNSYSILKTGRDEWGQFLPIFYFKSFGDFKLPVYIYINLPFIAWFGLNQFSVRLPSAFFGMLTIPATYFLTKEIFNSRKIGLLAASFIAVSSWHIILSRIAAESILGVFFTVSGSYFFLKGLKNHKFLFISIIFWILGFNSYHGTRGFILIYLPALIFFYRQQIPSKKLAIFSLILLLSFLFFFISLFSWKGQSRIFQTTSVSWVGILAKLNEARGNCLQIFPYPLCRIIYNRPLVYIESYINSYLNNFSVKNLFTTGFGGIDVYAMSGRPLLYLWELPGIIFGLLLLIQKKFPTKAMVFSWLLAFPVASSLTFSESSRRMTSILPLFQIIAAYGYWEISVYLKRISKFLSQAVILVGFLVILTSLVDFISQYQAYTKIFSKEYKYGYQQVYSFIAQYGNQYHKIYISRKDNEPHIYYLFYNQYDPRRYIFGNVADKGERREEYTKIWGNVDRIENIYFVSELSLDNLEQNSLYVIDGEDIKKFYEINKEEINQGKFKQIVPIYDLNNKVVFLIIGTP